MIYKNIKHLLILTISACILVAYGCAQPQKTTLSKQDVTSFNEKTAVPAKNLIQSATVNVATPEKSSITFYGKAFKVNETNKSDAHIDHDHWGGFKSWQGVAQLNSTKDQIEKLAFRVDMKSVYSDDDKAFGFSPSIPRDKRKEGIKGYQQNTNTPSKSVVAGLLTKHLIHTDLFDAKTFPYSQFVSTKITPKSGNKYDVEGDLLFRGYKIPKKFEATITPNGAEKTIHATAEMNIKMYQDAHIAYTGLSGAPMDTNVIVAVDLDFPTN